MLDFVIDVYHDQARQLLAVGVPVRIKTSYDNFVKEHDYPPCRVVREGQGRWLRYVFLEPEAPEALEEPKHVE